MPVQPSKALIGVGVLIAFFVLAPIGFLIFGMFWSSSPGLPGELTLGNVREGLDIGRHTALLSNSFVFAAGSAALAVTIGVGLSLMFQRTNTPGRRILDSMVLLNLVFPSFLLDIAWIFLLSPRIGLLNFFVTNVFGLQSPPFNIYSMAGMIWSQGLGLGVLSYLLISPAFANMDPSLEEAARVSGSGTRRTIRKVTLPILFPSILSTAIFMFMIGLRSFETPTFIGLPGGIRVYMNEIDVNIEVAIPPQYGLASTQASFILVIMLVILFIYLRSTRQLTKYVSVAGRGYRPAIIDLGRWKYLSLTFALGYMVLAILLPLALLLFISFVPFYTVTQDITKDLTLDNYLTVTGDAALRSATINSTLIALSAGVVTTIAGVALAYLALKSQWRGKRIFEAIGTVSLGYPGLVFGLALLWTFLTFLRPIFGTPLALIIAYMVIFLPIATRSISNTMIQLHPELEEASQVSGASWFATVRRITLPMLKPALVNTFILVMLSSYRELGTAVLLSGPGMYVIPVLILYYWRIGWLTSVAAATMIYSGLLAVILLMVRVFLRSGLGPR